MFSEYSLVVCIMLCSRIVLVQCCSCFPIHPQQLFCDSDYVIRAMVTSAPPPRKINKPSDVKSTRDYDDYTVTILHVYHGRERIFSILNEEQQDGHEILQSLKYSVINITVPSLESACGITLSLYKELLMMGQIRNGKMFLNSCSFTAEWSMITDEVKRGIHGDYDCRCYVKTKVDSSASEMTRDVSETTCYWSMQPNSSVDKCILNHLTCRKLVNPIVIDRLEENCVWVEGAEYAKCQEANQI